MQRSPWQHRVVPILLVGGSATKPLVEEGTLTIAFRVTFDGEQRFGARFQPTVLRPFSIQRKGVAPEPAHLLEPTLGIEQGNADAIRSR